MNKTTEKILFFIVYCLGLVLVTDLALYYLFNDLFHSGYLLVSNLFCVLISLIRTKQNFKNN